MEILEKVKLTEEVINFFSKKRIRTKTGVVRIKYIRSYNRFQKFYPILGKKKLPSSKWIMKNFFFEVNAEFSSLADVLIQQNVLNEVFDSIDSIGETVNLIELYGEWEKETGLKAYEKASVDIINAFLLENDVIKLKTQDSIFTDAIVKALSRVGIITLVGKVDLDRRETYSRFEKIYPFIEDLEEEMGAHELVKKCAFTPKQSVASLVDVLQEKGILDEYFLPMSNWENDIDDIYQEWQTETDLIPYEQTKKGLIDSFLLEREIENKCNFDMLNEHIGSEETFPTINSYFTDDY